MDGFAFELDAVSKTYHIWRLLRKVPRTGVVDVSIAVPRGQIIGFLGLNGAGKTTIMRLLVGLLEPDSGSVRILGGSTKDPAIRGRIGFLPEMPYLPQQMDARGLLKAYGMMSGFSGRDLENRIDRSLELAGLDPGRRDPLRFFSKGMRQRVAMAQVLLHDPEVIFVDEPMSGLDPLGIREMRNLLLDLRAAGTTVCLNSHQIPEVERICDRVAVMADGHLVLEGSVGELLAAAEERRYRLTLLSPSSGGPGAAGSRWKIDDMVVSEEDLAATLAEQRARKIRVLQILAERGSLEDTLLRSVANYGKRSLGNGSEER